jgi:hypothetical protein
MPDSKRAQQPQACSICGKPITPEPKQGFAGGFWAHPVNPGRCCYDCNWNLVVPARYRALYARALKNDGRGE